MINVKKKITMIAVTVGIVFAGLYSATVAAMPVVVQAASNELKVNGTMEDLYANGVQSDKPCWCIRGETNGLILLGITRGKHSSKYGITVSKVKIKGDALIVYVKETYTDKPKHLMYGGWPTVYLTLSKKPSSVKVISVNTGKTYKNLRGWQKEDKYCPVCRDQQPIRYYSYHTGVMFTGLHKIKGKLYYFQYDGDLVRNKERIKIENHYYRINKNGVATKIK